MRMHHIEIRIARTFKTYGTRMLLNDGRLISKILFKSTDGEVLTIYCNGNQTRSFCFIYDLLDSLIVFINSSNKGPMNLVNTEELYILKIANLIRNISIKNLKLSFKRIR